VTTKLSKSQRVALEWLSKGRWTAAWWGGQPHGRWPVQMSGRTYDSLRERGYIMVLQAERLDKTVYLTEAGRNALAPLTPQRRET